MTIRQRQTIWIVEDEAEICCLFADLLVDYEAYNVVCVEDARRVRSQPGDFIFLDLNGTRSQMLQPNGATVITMSGDDAQKPEIRKPFDFREIQRRMEEHLRARRSFTKAA